MIDKDEMFDDFNFNDDIDFGFEEDDMF